MLKEFIKYLEKRPQINKIPEQFPGVIKMNAAGKAAFTDEAFSQLVSFLEKGNSGYQHIAVQAAVRWTASSQKVLLRNVLKKRGFVSPSCLWAYLQVRGNPSDLLQDFPLPEMAFMQVVLLKEVPAELSIPFLIEKYLTNAKSTEELRAASRLSILRVLDHGISPDFVAELRNRYPSLEILNQWRPRLDVPQRSAGNMRLGKIDFHQLVRSLHDMKELSSLTRTVYLLSQFYLPLPAKDWSCLWLSKSDNSFFEKLTAAGMIEECDNEYSLCSDPTKQAILKRFLYESYPLIKDAVSKTTEARKKEERKQKALEGELDRAALDMMNEGVICIDRSGLLYYSNSAAEKILGENPDLKKTLFGSSIEEALKRYCKDSAISGLRSQIKDPQALEIFGDKVTLGINRKRFQIEFGPKIIVIRDITNQYLVDREIGSLYRHELQAALDVMGLGILSAQQFAEEGNIQELGNCLKQMEKKRNDLLSMLEEKMDFIRLHSDCFRIQATAVHLNLVVDNCLMDYREALQIKKVNLKSDHVLCEGLYVEGEERFLMKAISNIMRNAVKFAPKKSEIKISLQRDGNFAVLEIRDSGPGIPKENLGKVFQLGFTTNGTGRGLYLAKRIISAHNGRIEVKSKLGSGSCFVIRLPLKMEK